MEQNESSEEKRNFYSRLRESFLPLRPKDNGITRMAKNAGFYLFLIMTSLISLTIVAVITFVL